MDTDADQFEAELRRRDARRTFVLGAVLVGVAALFALGFAAVCVLVFVVARDADHEIRVPVAAFWVPGAAAIFLGAFGARSLSDGVTKRRAAKLTRPA
jgi:hypothetical protein